MLALAKVERLMDAKPGSAEEGQLKLWPPLVEHYENEHFLIDFPDPVEAILFRMEKAGLRQKDLARPPVTWPFLQKKSPIGEKNCSIRRNIVTVTFAPFSQCWP